MSDLLKHGLIFALLILIWFGLTMLSRNLLIQVILGWIGLGAVALYWRWLHIKKIR
jgi:hypothetical protein